MGEVLTLRTTAGPLWRLVRKPVAECLAELPGAPHECRLGGGTTLAARFRHRDSFDIDLTIGPEANLGYLRPRLEEALTKLGGRPRYRDGQLKVDFGTGLLDVSKLQPRPAGAQQTAIVDGEPFVVLSNAQILHGKMERAAKAPVRDVFDVIKTDQLDPHAVAVAVNARTRVSAELVCMSWEKANSRFGREAAEELLGVPESMQDDPDRMGLSAAAAAQGAIYKRVGLHTDGDRTIIETETRNGRPHRIELAPDELDRGFALNGLNEYFYYNVLGGDRLLECARSAVTNPSLPPIEWETGRVAPAPRTPTTSRPLDPER